MAKKHEAALRQFTAASLHQSSGNMSHLQAVRPFLGLASNFPFIPQSWRNGIKAFIAAVRSALSLTLELMAH